MEQTATNKDPYFVALVAGTLYNVGRTGEAAPLAKGLEKYQVGVVSSSLFCSFLS